MWQRGSPLGFQQFRNYYYDRHSINYKCRARIECFISSDFELPTFHNFHDWIYQEFTDPKSGTCLNLSNLTKTLQNTIQGSMTSNRECTIMLLMNLAEPDWLFIPCQEKTLYYTVCLQQQSKVFSKYHLINSKSLNGKHCDTLHVIISDACYAFVWQEKILVQSNFCEQTKGKTSYLAKFKQLKHFFKAFPIAVQTPIIFVKYKSSDIIAAKVVFETFNIPTITKTNMTGIKSQGYHVCHLNKFHAMTDSVTHYCVKGGHISLKYVCDQTIDCPNDNSDEQYCIFSIFPEKVNESYHLTGTKKCLAHYFSDIHGKCKQYSSSISSAEMDVFEGKHSIRESYFQCTDGQVIHPQLVNDLIPDCKIKSEDEPLLMEVLKNHVTNNLCLPNEIPCILGHSKCFKFTDLCNYKLNTFGHLVPCRNGAHLQNCKLFECNLKFKCWNSYCIAWAYVCDGKWDCPEGDDESFNGECSRSKQNWCVYAYKCKNTRQICIHLGNICDTQPDSPYGDDEVHCEIKGRVCPKSCKCLYFAIVCKSLQRIEFSEYNSNYIMADISRTARMLITIIFNLLPDVQILRLQLNNIKYVCRSKFPKYLKMLDISYNLVYGFSPQCFSNLLYLNSLFLQHNQISYLSSKSLFYMKSLQLLDISSNPLTYIPSYSFTFLPSIQLINFTHINFDYINVNIFVNTYPKLILTSHHGISCFIPDGTNYVSTSHFQMTKLCMGIVPKGLFKIFLCIIPLVIIVANLASSILHFYDTKFNKAFKTTVIAIDFHHQLHGIYLCIIWIYDTIVGNIYINDEIWRSHYLCLLASWVTLCFEIMNPSLLLFLSASRLMVVVFPLNSRFKDAKFTRACLSVLCGLSIFMSCFLILYYKTQYTSLPTVSCLPFSNKSKSLFYFITWSGIILKLIIFFVIIIMGFLLHRISNQSKHLKSTKFSVNSKLIVSQFVLQTTSNFLCWYPMNIIYIVLLFSSSYLEMLLSWSTVLILPINCLFYPVIFIINCLIGKGGQKK